jgi:hypothetical protein
VRTSIPFADVNAFIESLGADSNDVRSVLIEPDAVTVTEHRRNEDGNWFMAGREPAAVITTIRIDREP